MITWAGSFPEVECVILVVAGTDTTGCYMGIKMETTLSLSLEEHSLTVPSLTELSLKELSLSQPSFSCQEQFKEERKSSEIEMTTLRHKEFRNEAAVIARRGMLTTIPPL